MRLYINCVDMRLYITDGQLKLYKRPSQGWNDSNDEGGGSGKRDMGDRPNSGHTESSHNVILAK